MHPYIRCGTDTFFAAAYATACYRLYQIGGLRDPFHLDSPAVGLVVFALAALFLLSLYPSPAHAILFGLITLAGNLFYPGLLPADASLPDRLLLTLTGPGWLATYPLALILMYLFDTLFAALSHSVPRPSTWWLTSLPGALSIVFRLGEWWLLHTHGAALQHADLASWLALAFRDGPWPVAREAVVSVFLLEMWLLAAWLIAGSGRSTLVHVSEYVLLLTSPLWLPLLTGAQPVTAMTAWPSFWISAPLQHAAWIVLGVALLVLLSAQSLIKNLQGKRALASLGLTEIKTPGGGPRIVVPFGSVLPAAEVTAEVNAE